MYYCDHKAVAEKEITSRNCLCLVDAAVMLYEEDKKTKTLSAKEEESDKRIFRLFPRKTRTPVFIRRNPQQNLNGASSWSSSFLLDPNTIPADSKTRNPQNPNGLSSSSSSSFLLDLNTIPPDDSETQNPNGASSSSSSFFGDYKIAARSSSKMMDMRNSRNPNSQSSLSSCLTENKPHKRRATQDIKPIGKSKKAKVATFSWIGRETPEWLTLLMKDTNETVVKWGERTDLRLIFERTLFKTDVNPGESRLSMPFNELIQKDFLTPVEFGIIEEDINSDKKMGIGAILIDQQNVKWGVMLKRWEMKKDSGRGSWNYALTCGWNEIVKANGLKQGDDISIWSFRWGGLLCFALVTPPPSMAQSSSSLVV
ncbi:B3 domain-containing protein At3g25182 [Eutrema salsugineum]|uniref:B3 domain-containing protein At3g25182 n=1 Tax=Eutrema salsugineum TaxID=72664 RepID=UPI000CECE6A0|nr:B3 domain-containing protein At3g25182 [Eutrema salsugineum]